MSKQPTAEISHTRSYRVDFCVRRRDFPMTEAQNVPPRNRPSFVESVTPGSPATRVDPRDTLRTAHLTSQNMASQLLPLELIDKCVGSRIWVIMKGDKGASDLAPEYPNLTY